MLQNYWLAVIDASYRFVGSAEMSLRDFSLIKAFFPAESLWTSSCIFAHLPKQPFFIFDLHIGLCDAFAE